MQAPAALAGESTKMLATKISSPGSITEPVNEKKTTSAVVADEDNWKVPPAASGVFVASESNVAFVKTLPAASAESIV